ncbi:MAG: hypothetical protein IPH26_07430 [Sterolibacteriaceae bacterium]|uniref:Uncharacterized protein n=1 Tax=Candidatus Methylophosphatis roskildensis TaxID=2899263 RepID=A0A9D7DXS1_9PROT|nr:hypothetical protein [Candidatus Methylophosphatis roskildensis]
MASQRAAIQVQGGAEIFAPCQAKLHHLHRGQALTHGVALGVREHRYAVGDVGYLTVVAHNREHRVDLFSSRGLHRQMRLGRHQKPPQRGAVIITHLAQEVQ